MDVETNGVCKNTNVAKCKNADQLSERYIKIKVIKYCVDGRYTVRKELLSSD